jgi:K+-transporting ATPase ATPase C chain
MKKNIITSILFLILMTLLTGLLYPLLMTDIAQLIFPYQSNGSMIKSENKIVGSELIGQNFTDEKYFKGRPSAINYNPMPSGASNLGPTSKILEDSIKVRRENFIKENGLQENAEIPNEMLTSSASGVDPNISIKAAKLQISRIIKSRGWDKSYFIKIKDLINRLTEKPQFGILGEERINVLELNTELDKLK